MPVAAQERIYDSPEVLALLQQVRCGNEQAFTTLYKLYYPRALAACQRFIDEQDIAEGTANWALTRAWLKIEGFKGSSSFATWVTRIAMNAAIMHLRKQKAEDRVIAYSLDDIERADDLPGQVDLNLVGMADRSALLHEIRSLPDNLRTVFVMRLVKGFTTRETCKALGLDILTVRRLLSEARKQLVEVLGRKPKAKAAAPKKRKAVSHPKRAKTKIGPAMYAMVEKMWNEGKLIPEIAQAVNRMGNNPKDPYHPLRTLLSRMHKGFRNSAGDIVKLPYRVQHITIQKSVLAGKKAKKVGDFVPAQCILEVERATASETTATNPGYQPGFTTPQEGQPYDA